MTAKGKGGARAGNGKPKKTRLEKREKKRARSGKNSCDPRPASGGKPNSRTMKKKSARGGSLSEDRRRIRRRKTWLK